MQPKISVIVPIYNSEKYLRQCLDSILNQTLRFFELILIDDGSKDQSLSICIEYAQKDSRIQIYKQKHKGPGPARNLGIKLANGKYFSFLDSDDFFELDMLEKLYKNAEKTKSDIVFYLYSKFDNLSQRNISITPSYHLDKIPQNYPFNPKDYADILFQLSGSEAWKYFFKKEFIYQHNLKFAKTTCGEDAVFTIPARALAKRMLFLNKVCVYYRINTKNQLTKHTNVASQLKKSYKQAEKILKKLGIFDDLRNSFEERKRIANLWLNKVQYK